MGKLTCSFLNVNNGNLKTTISGMVLRHSDEGHGFFKAVTNTGALRLQGN